MKATRTNANRPARKETTPAGTGDEVLLQGFHWHSHEGVGRKSWYRVLRDHAPHIRDAGFTGVWMPPPSDSLAPQGYIPRRWNVFDSAYGTEKELRKTIAALGPVKAIADVVLNHRVGVHTAGADFMDPPFRDNRAAIACDDSSGVGTGAPDSGEHHPAGRDLDHSNPDVRRAVKTYLRRLSKLGFRGRRYDLVKGFGAEYVGEYNADVPTEFSVGEVYDYDRQGVVDWIDGTGGRSCAFDFPLRLALQQALASDDYSGLRTHNYGRTLPAGAIGFWASRAVTFLDNHDTEYRRQDEEEYRHSITRHFAGTKVERGYAILLTHPGTPSVFWSHFFEWGERARDLIRALILVRREARITATSRLDIEAADRGRYAAVIDGRLAVKVGSRDWSPGAGWGLRLAGEDIAVWTRENA